MIADVVIIGSGPAGIQAAIHSSRKKANTILIGKPANSAISGAHVENYFGVAGVVDGNALLQIGSEQARSFGCKMIEQNVVDAEGSNGAFTITIESGEIIEARTVILATGVSRVKLNVPGEKELLGKGVSYCATCDCNFFKGVPVAIIGNESEAAISSTMMTRYASKVYWVSDGLDVDTALVLKAKEAGVEIIDSRAVAIIGDTEVTSLRLKENVEIPVKGVFIELGGKSSENIAMDLGMFPETDDTIRVNDRCETTVAGVFACGDVTGKPWQVAKAVGQGSIAGANAADHSKVSK